MSTCTFPINFDFEIGCEPSTPEYFKCEQCKNVFDIDIFYAMESDKCHHCRHYNGDISDALFDGYIKLFGE